MYTRYEGQVGTIGKWPRLTHNVSSSWSELISFVPSIVILQVMELPSLISSFSLIDDRRSNKNKRYPLPLLLLIAFCASISNGIDLDPLQCRAMVSFVGRRAFLGDIREGLGEGLESDSSRQKIPDITTSVSIIPRGAKRTYRERTCAPIKNAFVTYVRWLERTYRDHFGDHYVSTDRALGMRSKGT